MTPYLVSVSINDLDVRATGFACLSEEDRILIPFTSISLEGHRKISLEILEGYAVHFDEH